MTKAVRPLNLPSSKVHVKPGDVCYVAGWGQLAPKDKFPNTLQEVELTVQKDQECESQYPDLYNKAIEMCVGDPKIKRASFYVSLIFNFFVFCGREKQSETQRASFKELFVLIF